MTAKLTEMELSISKYKHLRDLMRTLETKKEELKLAILLGLNGEIKFVGKTGSAAKVDFTSRHTNFSIMKELLDDDVYYQIVTETPSIQLRVG
mgnify:CR=1 FL=1